MRKDDIKELLEITKEDIKSIEKKYVEALNDESIKAALRVRVKSCLENLRSCLDYIACDIYEKYYRLGQTKIYFPYGKKPQNFRSNLGNNFKDLKNKNKKIYDALESVQPYKCGDNWIVDLCGLTNINKHDNLTKQVREDYVDFNINGINFLRTDGKSEIKMSGCTFNGVHQGDDFTIRGKEILTKGKVNLDIIKIDWIKFKFENTDIDVLDLLNKSYVEITKLSNEVYILL